MKNKEFINFVVSSCDKMLKVLEKQRDENAGYVSFNTDFQSQFKNKSKYEDIENPEFQSEIIKLLHHINVLRIEAARTNSKQFKGFCEEIISNGIKFLGHELKPENGLESLTYKVPSSGHWQFFGATTQRISQANQILNNLTKLAGVLSSDFEDDIRSFIKASKDDIEISLRKSRRFTEETENLAFVFPVC